MLSLKCTNPSGIPSSTALDSKFSIAVGVCPVERSLCLVYRLWLCLRTLSQTSKRSGGRMGRSSTHGVTFAGEPSTSSLAHTPEDWINESTSPTPNLHCATAVGKVAHSFP